MKKIVVAFLRKIHLYNVALKVYRKCTKPIREYKLKKKEIEINNKVEKVASQAKALIEEIKACSIGKNIIYIFQQTYYTTDGRQYISGGGERYASDLSDIIFEMGYQPVLIQFGEPHGTNVWKVKRKNLYVLGLNIEWGLYPRTIEKLEAPTLAIYSGFTDFGKRYFTPNIVISHGITWDAPFMDVRNEKIKEILFRADNLVSVDTNTISYMRTCFSKTLSEKHVNMQYIPNYTDINKYVPDETKRDKEYIRVIFPRRCSPERGFWLITKILPILMERYASLIFDYVGFIHTDDIGDAIEKLKRNYPGRVNHYFVDAEEMYTIYQKADITLIPTLYCEGTSLSCIEAMACGNVVISTNIGGLPNLIINGYNGFLINPDEKELLEVLDATLNDAEMRKRMEKRAVEVAATFSKEKWEAKWRKILSDSLGRSN